MMRLSDIISKVGASFFIQIALILFFTVFVGVLVYAYILLGNDAVKKFSSMPLDDDDAQPHDPIQRAAPAQADAAPLA